MSPTSRPGVVHARAVARQSVTGVTLVELLTVIAIVAIMMAIGVPSYRYINTSYRISAEVNGLLGDFQFARAEAIKEGQTVTVCISADGATCAAGTTAWQTGWIVFSDANGNQTVDASDTVLRVQSAFTGTDTFEPSDGLSSAVTFNRDGFAFNLPGGATLMLTLHDATDNSAWTRCLDMSMVGLMAVTPYSATAPFAWAPACT
ncbi:MAG: GspH/FimT family pseudopilin [Steroidobacteraceae bacterium]